MKSLFISAALLAAMPAYAAGDVDILPYGYVAQAMRETKASSHTQAKIAAAQAAGELPVGEAGVQFRDAPTAKSRAQVIVETQEAARLGLLVGGESDAAQANAEQDERIRQAVARALGMHTAAQ